jgi:uncharacterized SAM-binding protein YcdF (DUF218 family)
VIRRVAARALGVPLERASPAGAADAVVILGAPLAPDGLLTDVLRERVLAGYELWQGGAAPLVCVTGGPSRGRTEAGAMAEALRDLGLPADALRVEAEARSTAENATRTATLLAADGVRSVWVVTQPFHLRRACWLFRRAGLEPRGWRIAGGIQDRDPERALRWIGREYGAWARALLRR